MLINDKRLGVIDDLVYRPENDPTRLLDKPLGRDRLGRLLYVGDYVTIGTVRAFITAPIDEVWPHNGFYCVFEHDGSVREGASATGADFVDLEASPKRTNYERYFADLGTLSTVCVAKSKICFDTPTSDCVEGKCTFGYWCGVGKGLFFYDWLKEKATI